MANSLKRLFPHSGAGLITVVLPAELNVKGMDHFSIFILVFLGLMAVLVFCSCYWSARNNHKTRRGGPSARSARPQRADPKLGLARLVAQPGQKFKQRDRSSTESMWSPTADNRSANRLKTFNYSVIQWIGTQHMNDWQCANLSMEWSFMEYQPQCLRIIY